MLIIFVFAVIGFNYTVFVYDLNSKQLEESFTVYLDSLKKFKYFNNILGVKTTLYISFHVILSFIILQIVLTSALIFRFKYKKNYALFKLVNFFMTVLIITFIFVILFHYINNIGIVKKY